MCCTSSIPEDVVCYLRSDTVTIKQAYPDFLAAMPIRACVRGHAEEDITISDLRLQKR